MKTLLLILIAAVVLPAQGIFFGTNVTASLGTVATPTLDNDTGSYVTTVTVTPSDATSGSAMFFCTNVGSDCTPGTSYSSPITITVTATHLCVNATKALWTASATKCATYTITVAPTTPTVVQTKQQFTGGGSATVVTTMNSVPTASSCMLLAFHGRLFGATGITSVVDSNAHISWTKLDSGNDGASPMVDVEFWVGAVSATLTASVTQTVNYGTGSNSIGVVTIIELNNIPDCTATGRDATSAFNSASSTTPTTAAYTTTHANDFLVAILAVTADGCNHAGAPTVGGYTALTCIDSGGGNDTHFVVYKLLSSAGAQSATYSTTFGNAYVTGLVAMKGN